MVIFPYKHSFATQVLWEHNIKLYSGNEQILIYPFEKKHWEYPQLETKIVVGQNFGNPSQGKYKLIENYEDLLQLGFIVTIRKASGKLFRGQKVEYLLAKKGFVKYDYGRIPENHIIDFDIVNKRIRLRGKNSLGLWTYIRHSGSRKEYNTSINPYDPTSSFKRYGETMRGLSPFNINEEPIEISIDEIPIMFSEDGSLICKAQGKDTSIIGWYGMRRSGKSIGMHGFLERAFHKWKIKPFIANDIQRETGTWSVAWNNPTFLRQLEQIGETSQPLPMVYLHPFTYDFKGLINQEVGFPISLPFKECMREYEWFLKGKREWEFEKSGTYFRNMMFNDDGTENKNGLLNCKSYSDMLEMVDEKEAKEVQREEKGKVIVDKYVDYVIENDKVRYKIKNVLKDIANTQMFDIINKIPSKWSVELPDGKHPYYPWTACMIAGLVPSMITSEWRTKHFFPQAFRFVIEDLFQFQKEDSLSVRNRWEIGLAIDELQGITNNEDTKETLSKIVRESGLARINVYYTSLNVEKVPDDMKLNTDTVFVFRQKKQQASLIAKDFDLLNYKEKELMRLNKFECVAVGSFVAYNSDGDREIIEDEPIRGTILPSVSMHQAPRLTGDEE